LGAHKKPEHKSIFRFLFAISSTAARRSRMEKSGAAVRSESIEEASRKYQRRGSQGGHINLFLKKCRRNAPPTASLLAVAFVKPPIHGSTDPLAPSVSFPLGPTAEIEIKIFW